MFGQHGGFPAGEGRRTSLSTRDKQDRSPPKRRRKAYDVRFRCCVQSTLLLQQFCQALVPDDRKEVSRVKRPKLVFSIRMLGWSLILIIER